MVVLSSGEGPGLILAVRMKNRVIQFLPVRFEVLEDVVAGVFCLVVIGNHG
jgi:hypothetical protein